VSLEQLWAGWRHDYIVEATARQRTGTSNEASGCVFCRLAASGPPSEENLVVWRGEWTFVVLNAYPYASGHVLVLPLRHVGGLGALTAEESSEMWVATQGAIAAIEAAYDPDGLNMGANLGRAAGAGLPAHVHVHVLPRWSGDTNFMTSIAGARVMPEMLPVAWKKLSGAWKKNGNGHGAAS
jgi:ATP adenylyltransferase